MNLAIRLGLRDLGGHLRGFRVFLGCLIIGVAAIAGVGSLTTALVDGLRDQGQVLLGGDVELRLTGRPATPEERDALASAGTVSEAITLRTMARSPTTGVRGLAELKAVDGRYPLYGSVKLKGGGDVQDALALKDGVWGAVIAPELASRLNISVGDRLGIGKTEVVVRAVIAHEPDRVNDGFTLAPRLMIAQGALDGAGLLTLGSLNRHSYRVKLPPGTDLAAWRNNIEAAFPDAGWRIRDRNGSAPRVREFVGRVRDFLTLVGLIALVVGGVGVGNAVSSHLGRKAATIATLKTLGATARTIFRIYLTQVLALAGVAIVVGLALGAVLPHAVVALAGDRLPVIPTIRIYPLTLCAAALYGLLVTLAFTLWPLAAARDVPAARLFRHQISAQRRVRRTRDLAAIALIVVLLLALPFIGAEAPLLVAWFEAGAAGAVLLLAGLSAGLKRCARGAGHVRRPVLRLALANLYRPGAPTTAVTLSLGLGLTLFTTLALVEGNLNRQINATLPEAAPSFYFIDIQKNEIGGFLAKARAIAGVTEVRATPYLRGRIVRVNGVPAALAKVEPDARWVLRGDRGLTYSPSQPKDNRLIAGDWWPTGYAGPPEISFDAGLAQKMGLTPGDTLTIDVLGRTIKARIRNLRQIDWGTLSLNFAVMFDPATLKPAPHSYLATLKVKPEAEATAYRTLTDAFPNVSAVRMKEVLNGVAHWLGEMGAAVSAAAAVTIVVGILVLAGAMAAGERHHIADAVILKTLGATRRTIFKVLVTEYAILGLVTGLTAIALGTVAARVLVTMVMHMQWTFLPVTAGLATLAALVLTLGFGLAGTWAALGVRPARAMRALT